MKFPNYQVTKKINLFQFNCKKKTLKMGCLMLEMKNIWSYLHFIIKINSFGIPVFYWCMFKYI